MFRIAGLSLTLVFAVLLLAGCSRPAPSGPPAAAARPSVPDTLTAYAKQLGGTPHKGSELYLVVGGSYASAQEAQAALDAALPRFGDMQSYVIVQHSDSFTGITATGWVVVEAYRDPPSEENLQFVRRGFPQASVQPVVVKTPDPIPVYEEIVPR